MIIFCDGIFDLFHSGHVNHFKQIKTLNPNSTLIVGVLNDIDTTAYKRKPYYDETKRLLMVKSCKYVDKTLLEYPIIITKEFIDKYNIDLVVHSFYNKNDYEKQYKFFKIPIELNKFKCIDYDSNISTTKIINDIIKNENENENKNENENEKNKCGWDLIWELKGKNDDLNPFNLNGYDDTLFDPHTIYNNIITKFNLKCNEKILEIGCGAGLISQFFNNDYDYYGIDYSYNLIIKNIKLFNSKLFNCEATSTPFKNNYFDYSFCIGVFEYFPDTNYSKRVLEEMKRVTKKAIYILNIRKKTHNNKKTKHKFDGVFTHLIHNPNDPIFNDFEVCDASYEHENRFSVYKLLI